jgi:hypothetical protein
MDYQPGVVGVGSTAEELAKGSSAAARWLLVPWSAIAYVAMYSGNRPSARREGRSVASQRHTNVQIQSNLSTSPSLLDSETQTVPRPTCMRTTKTSVQPFRV